MGTNIFLFSGTKCPKTTKKHTNEKLFSPPQSCHLSNNTIIRGGAGTTFLPGFRLVVLAFPCLCVWTSWAIHVTSKERRRYKKVITTFPDIFSKAGCWPHGYMCLGSEMLLPPAHPSIPKTKYNISRLVSLVKSTVRASYAWHGSGYRNSDSDIFPRVLECSYVQYKTTLFAQTLKVILMQTPVPSRL